MKLVVWLAFLMISLTSPALGKCRQALVLGMDVSGSVNDQEYWLQREGLAAALMSPKVQAALFEIPEAPVRLMVFEWSGGTYQRPLTNWIEINGPKDISDFVAQLRNAPKQKRPYSTALGNAMQFGVASLQSHAECWRRTLDISGDGKANEGNLPYGLFRGEDLGDIVINGLVIGSDDGQSKPLATYATDQLATYFESNVIRGRDAFVEKAMGFDDFQNAMERKLLRELAALALGELSTDGATTFAFLDQ